MISKEQRFGKLTTKSFHTKNGRQIWMCICDCGEVTFVKKDHLLYGYTKSCGCFRVEMGKIKNKTHGMTSSRTWNSWVAMKRRCEDNHAQYSDYGGRGITVCERWLHSFENFLEDMGERPEGMTLDRKENNKGYYKDNCKWSTRKEQNNNQRTNKFITYSGRTQTISQWEDELGIIHGKVWRRIFYYNWSIEKALTYNTSTQKSTTLYYLNK